jgi:hypothetical protein
MTELQNAAELDAYLQQVVQALHRTVNYALPRLKDDDQTDKAIRDCDEILTVILAGRVSDWIA